jgi:DNA polymerase III alpha subunit (gram-positive type)
MSYTLYVCDTETTGTDPANQDIIEVCFWRLNDDESKTWCLKPLNIEAIDDRALKVNKHKRDDIIHKTAKGRETYREPSEVLPEIEMWIMQDGACAEDRVFIGQNPQFDYDFLWRLWQKLGNEDSFPFGRWLGHGEERKNLGFLIDTIQMARVIDICVDKKRNRYGLGALVKDFGITRAQSHRADGDVKMTKDLFLKMFEPLKDLMNQEFSDCY